MEKTMADCIETLRVNWRDTDRAEARWAFQCLHRTEKQNVLRNLVSLLEEAACDHQDHNVDLRNQASSEWASKALELPHHFPYV